MSVAEQVSRDTPTVHLRIGSERRLLGSGGTFSHVSATTGRVDAEVPLAGPQEIDEAVTVAHAAFQSWRRTPPIRRRQLLLRLADLIESNSDEFCRLGALDNGTPVRLAMGADSAEWFRYYAGWADKLDSQVVANYAADGHFGYTVSQPYGVIGIIVTWNGPLGSLAMKIPAALAGGNTVVVKPSELTPFSGELFADLVVEAGFPPGVINILPGNAEAGEALVRHPLVQKISFTGGPVTARKIAVACAEQMKPTVMELGGKSANIVFDDADVNEAAQFGAMRPLAILSGQGCSLPTRLLVQRPIYDEVVESARVFAEAIVVGDPFDPRTVSGPIVNEASLERILGMIERAKADGSRLVTGGSRLGGALADGYYLEPTVFADVDPASELAQNEVFGPVLAITPFDTEAEAIELANSTEYGLSGYIRTRDISRALRVAEELITGDIHINGYNRSVGRPFGGFKASGHGKEGGRAGVEEFLRLKAVSVS